jgi:ribosomal protein S18 acetylase RimI-like enzyme
MIDFTIAAADTMSAADLHAATIAAFADYLAGPFQMTLEQWPSFTGRQGVDLAASRVALREGRIVAFAFVAPRVDVGRWRLAVMGALPEARGSGAAPALLDDFIARATAEDLPEIELECFAQNERALRLYRSRGFEVVCELHGWKAPAPAADATGSGASGPAQAPREVDRATALAWLANANLRVADLPFPMTARSVSAQVRPPTFWQHGQAQLVFSVVEGTPVQVHSLVDLDPAQQDAQALVHALLDAHGRADIVVPPIQRDDLGGDALRREGFAPNGLHQVLMKRILP